MENIKVNTIFICKQIENSENYQEFLKIIRKGNIEVKVVEAGNRINLDKQTYFDILWPMKNQLLENPLNNNSIVLKFIYKNFSILFTGDIEEIAENKIVELYKNSNILKSTILKVAHHGSKTSTTENFLNKVSPKFAVIGVGKNNMFGHPSPDVITRLENKRHKNL